MPFMSSVQVLSSSPLALDLRCHRSVPAPRLAFARTELVRVGHTVFIPDGRPISFRQLPPNTSQRRFPCAAASELLICSRLMAKQRLPHASCSIAAPAVRRVEVAPAHPDPPEVDAVPLLCFAAKVTRQKALCLAMGRQGWKPSSYV
jgi:hypothetical protein